VEHNDWQFLSPKTAIWKSRYQLPDNTVNLWLEDGLNTGHSKMSVETVAVHKAKKNSVSITNIHQAGKTYNLRVRNDRYILYEAENKGIELPYACRMGCCTACAVRICYGAVSQPEALGISKSLKNSGYALLCVGLPRTDCVMQTVSEDEIYDLQFGQNFAAQALDPRNSKHISRDDFAVEIALGDE
jgi:ferredoxin